MSAVWTLAEQEAGRLRRVSFELLAWGRTLADRLTVPLCSLVLADHVEGSELDALIAHGADQVLLAHAPELAHFVVEPHAAVLEMLARERRPEIIIAAATTTGRTLMPYLAVRLGTGLTADCTGLEIEAETGNLRQTRPAIGGNILATIVTARHRPQMATVRPRSVRPPEPDLSRSGEVVELSVSDSLLASPAMRLDGQKTTGDAIDIQDAEVVVAGGRGLKRAENFELVRRLADALGGAVGASRETVEREWISYPHQVGLSGKTVTPRLYVAAGISGAIQHLAGMKTAENIVAVNTDPDAQIFDVADFGIVGDLFEVLPALVEEIERRKAR